MGTIEELAKATGFYYRDRSFSLRSAHVIRPPSYLAINIGDDGYKAEDLPDLDLTEITDWAASGYTSGAARAGLDISIFAVVNTKKFLELALSANNVVPAGYTTQTSKLVGGVHCLPAACEGLASSHPYYGKVQGDPMQHSIWDQWDRPACDPRGMVKNSSTPEDGLPKLWADIYLASQNAINALTSAYGAGILCSKDWAWFVRLAATAGKRLMTDQEFMQFAIGSNEETNIVGSADPLLTSLSLDTASRSMISNRGGIQYAGVKNQWLDEESATIGSISASLVGGGAFNLAASTSQMTVKYYAAPTGNQIKASFNGANAYLYGALAGICYPAFSGSIFGEILNLSHSANLTIYYDDDATDPNKRLLTDESPAVNYYIPTTDLREFIQIIYDVDAPTKGVPLYYDYGLDEFQAVNAGGVDSTFKLTQLSISQPTLSFSGVSLTWQDLPDGRGSLYGMGDIKAVAGGCFNQGAYCGDASRMASYPRWTKLSSIGARFCCEPAAPRLVA